MGAKTLHKTVLSEQIRENIMESILNGEFKPGEKLVENTLAKEYGVSQAPVREAIKGLAAMGLVSVEPYVGTRVKAYGREFMKEYFVVRSALEGLAGRLAVENRTDEELAELEVLLEDMIAAAHEKDYERRGEINQVFHNLLIESSHNSLLINLCKNVRLGSWSRFTSRHTEMDPEYIAERHRELLRCLKERDADGMERAVQRHIQESYDNFSHSFFAEEKGE